MHGSISPLFYAKLLLAQITKVQKDTDDMAVFLCFWDLVQAANKTLVKSTTGRQFFTKVIFK